MFYKTSDTPCAQYKTPLLEMNSQVSTSLMQQSLLEVHVNSLNVSCNQNSVRQNHFEQRMLQCGQFFTKLLLQCIQEGVYAVLSTPQDNLGDSRFWTVSPG